MLDTKNSFIRSLRFNRNQPGMLAVLSRVGQLKVLSTKQEFMEPEVVVEGSPELLEVERAMRLTHAMTTRCERNDRSCCRLTGSRWALRL